MRALSFLAIVILGGASLTTAQNWKIVPGESVGPIDQNTSEKKLIKIFGKANVRRAQIDVGEGEKQAGTILFPNDPRKKAFVFWRDTTRQRPESISFRNRNTLWKTDKGITIGTPLKTIEELNGKAFVLAGFGWDYGGTVMHANGGRLTELGAEVGEEIVDRTLLLRLEPSIALQKTRDYDAVQGDGKFPSDNPAMRKLNPRVYEMTVFF